MAKKRNKSIHCPNCDFQFKEVNNYCPNCGQENHSHNVSLKELFLELLETTLHFDTKLLLTLRTGFSKPGKVSSDFIAGKKARYVPPFRFYIFVSILFFLALGFAGNNSTIKKEDVIKIDNTDNNQSEADTAKTASEDSWNDIQLDSNSFNIGDGTNSNQFEKSFTEKLNHFMKYDKKEIASRLTKFTSYFMFFFMPFSALFLALFYIRKKRNYYEYLIFSIFTHAFIFIIFVVGIVLNYFINRDWVTTITILSAFAYFLISLKNLYQQSWGKTIFKFLVISFLYIFTGFILLLLFILGGIYLT